MLSAVPVSVDEPFELIQTDFSPISPNLAVEYPATEADLSPLSPESIPLAAAPTGYHEGDFTCIQAFLEQKDSRGVKNGTKINYAYSSYRPGNVDGGDMGGNQWNQTGNKH